METVSGPCVSPCAPRVLLAPPGTAWHAWGTSRAALSGPCPAALVSWPALVAAFIHCSLPFFYLLSIGTSQPAQLACSRATSHHMRLDLP